MALSFSSRQNIQIGKKTDYKTFCLTQIMALVLSSSALQSAI